MVAEVEYLQHPYNIKQIYAKRRGTLKHIFANGKKGIEKFTLDSFCQQSEKYLNYREPLLSVIFNNYFFNQFNYLIHNGRKKRNDQKRHEHKVKIKYLEAINN